MRDEKTDYKVVQTVTSACGRFDPGRHAILTWLRGFERSVMLHFATTPAIDDIPFSRLWTILYLSVSPAVQQFLETCDAVFTWKDVRDKL